MQKYKYLNFFNKEGAYCNFEYDENLDKWTGRIDLDVVSEGLIEDYQLFIMEEVYNVDQAQYEYTKPILHENFIPPNGLESADILLEYGGISEGTILTDWTSSAYGIAKNYICEFQNDVPIPELFLYSFELDKKSEDLLVKNDRILFEIDTKPYTISNSANISSGIKVIKNEDVNAVPLQINIGFCPEGEDLFGNYLFIKDAVGHIIAEIFVYGESIEEDERLSNLLQAMGYDLLPGDFVIFDEYDINEIKPDWKLINEKRKELLLEHDNIFPFIGSYKALINIIKFFGYQNLRMKEYWESIDVNSSNFGKYKQMDINDIFTENANFNTDITTPNKVYKKTNKFGLFYDLTVESGEYDEDGLPIAKETYLFTPQEALIKIFALKKKLQNYFLGLNSKIVDIIAESVFFAKYELNVWSDQQKIDYIDIGITPTFKVHPSIGNTGYGKIEDLRPLLTYGFPVGSDLNMGGYSKLNMWRIGIGDDINTYGPLNSEQTYELTFSIPGPTATTISTTFKLDLDTGKFIYTKYEIANSIISNIKANESLNNSMYVYQEGGTSGIIRLVQKFIGGTGTIHSRWYSNTDPNGTTYSIGKYTIPGSTGGTSTYINISPDGTVGPTGSPISYYGDAFIGYFNNQNFDIRKLNDDEDIPVGCPLVLENTSFNISWNDADVTFNDIDKIDSSTNKILFSKFTRSKNITGWTTPSQPIYTTVSGFPVSSFPSRFNYTWNNLAQYGHHEMQWKVYFGEKLIIDSGKDFVEKINKYPIILPYEGTYKVELHLWDEYNSKSSCIKSDIIEIDTYDIDFIGWYKKMDPHYNLDSKKWLPQTDKARKISQQGYFLPPEYNEYLTWDEYTSSWDLPFHPNEDVDFANIQYNSLDSLEYYKSIKNPIKNPLVDRFAYTYELMGNEASLEDLYHLWWDSTGSDITQFNITGITGPTSYIAMTRGNTIYSPSANLYIEEGPTGYTGPIGMTSFIGNTGDIIHSYANSQNFIFNKGEWKSEQEFIDIYRATNLTGTDRQKMLELTRQLNQVMITENREHPYLKDFIYTFNEEYYTESGQLKLRPYIRAISKNTESRRRHKLKYIGCTGDSRSYNTVNFGYVGDQPLSFEIYNVESTGPTGGIFIPGMTSSYNIGATNLYDLFKELNGSTAQNDPILNKFTYSLITNYPNNLSTGIGSTAYYTKIQAISKSYNAPSINIQYDKINGTTFARSLMKNVSWDEIRLLKYNQEIPVCTTVNFTYDNAKMPSKKNPTWILRKEGDSTFPDIYYNNKYFSYMFNQKGSYTLTLELEDTNGNKKSITKKEIIKII